MYDKIGNDSRVYTDIQGLEQLHLQNKTDHKAAKKEVSQQFEAILMQMVLRSMRDANKTFASDLIGNNQMDFYQDFFDKQLSLIMSNNSNSVAKMIEKNIDQNDHSQDMIEDTPKPNASPSLHVSNERYQPNAATIQNTTPAKEIPNIAPVKSATETAESTHFDTEESFVKHLWPAAKAAASALGLAPGILIAQAALETNWGKKILPNGKDNSSFNLFNIKSGSSWDKKTTTIESLEQKNGVLVREKSNFRSYDSFKESFMDYVSFLKENVRYNTALTKAAHPEAFAKALQEAGFATDTHYADKIVNIFGSTSFKKLIAKME
ncbi:MAG: flagellar assembly peptidoglycan hydrolase FlgJ [Gammaproteobacteria bacterium]|nr:flagellar assembly peptidoglycan hydrolase FlgJ [Gammaproteobacteria bacterium]